MKKTKVYLAGQMGGIEDFNHPRFNKCASRLRKFGYEVINPAELDIIREEECVTWEDYLISDIPRLIRCQKVAVIPGWENSKGARLEVHIAKELGMRVFCAETLHIISMERKPFIPTENESTYKGE